MAEIEAPTEALTEELHHQAHSSKETWVSQVALSSAVLAVLAAVAALIANHHANEAMIEQIQASNQWGYYQAKSIKATLLGAKLDLLDSIGKPVEGRDQDKLSEYKKDQVEISERAQEKEKLSASHLHHHIIFARSVTLFQIAIGVAAMAVLAKRRKIWLLGVGFGFLGICFFVQGLLSV